ncbi:MAG: hypothetical protein AAFQ36_01440 [Pseudomonadota bacterium]
MTENRQKDTEDTDTALEGEILEPKMEQGETAPEGEEATEIEADSLENEVEAERAEDVVDTENVDETASDEATEDTDSQHWSEEYEGVTGDEPIEKTVEDPEWHYPKSGAVYARAEDVPEAPVEETPEATEQTPEPEDVQESEEIVQDEIEEQEQRSLASRVLYALFLLIIGGTLFLWAGPRIAPNLPSGLSPVAAWLTPGSPAEIEALRAELAERDTILAERLGALEAAPGLESAVSEMEARAAALRGEVNNLTDQVTATDSGAIEARLAETETSLAGISAQLAELSGALTGLAGETADLPELTNTALEALTAEITGLRAELSDLAARQGELSQRIDLVAANADRRVAEAEEQMAATEAAAAANVTAAAARAELNALRAALESGGPYAAALQPVGLMTDIPPALATPATTGLATQAELESTFPDLAHAAIRADILSSAGDSTLARAAAEVRARAAGRLIVETPGEGTDATLSRVEARLKERDLETALREASFLGDAAQAELSSWLDAVTLRAAALEAFAAVESALSATPAEDG